MIISHNLLAMNANRQLNTVGTSKKKATERLSSGYKINRAADDAAGLTISEKMRYMIRGLNQGMDNIQDGISLTQVADGALGEIHDMLHREEELLIKAANGTNTQEDRDAIQQELNQLTTEIDRVFDTTEFNTIPVFKGKKTVISGPTNTTTTDTPVERSLAASTYKDQLVWFAKDATPPAKVERSNTETFTTTSTDTEISDKVTGKDTDGSDIYTYKKSEVVNTVETVITTKTTEEYIKKTDDDYAKAKKPTIGASGYMNFYTNGGISLSCAMSQLAVKVHSDNVDFASNDMCSDSNVKKVTTELAAGNGYETVYTIGVKNTDGTASTLEIIQEVKTNSAGNGYDISFKSKNNSDAAIDVDIKFALDTLNAGDPINRTKAQDGDASNFTITSENIKAIMNSSGAKKSVLNSIESLYNKGVDLSSFASDYIAGGPLSYHTGLGLWYEAKHAGTGEQTLGGATYTVEYVKDPYVFRVTDEITADSKETTTTKRNSEEYEYKLENILIQASSVNDDSIGITLFNLSAENLGMRAGIDVDVNNFKGSIANINRVTSRISEIRSYYGAVTNKLEHAFNNNANKAENTQAAESRIRDADMAAQMVEFSKNNILEQAGMSMLAQTNQNQQSVLSLLQ